jgi:hypothetical protein
MLREERERGNSAGESFRSGATDGRKREGAKRIFRDAASRSLESKVNATNRER